MARSKWLNFSLMKKEMNISSDIEDFWKRLKTQRDEMQVQAHLARAEFRDEWEEVEEKMAKGGAEI